MATQTLSTHAPQIDLNATFWSAPDDALLPRPVTAAGLGYSVSWLELKATKGGGPRMVKIGRRVMYRKSDVLAWLDVHSREVSHTSELVAQGGEQ